jgi:tRNA1(Val) A37 N6-methylase TrmN6
LLFYQPPDGYRYNSDSIFLYKFIKGFKPKGDILDVGCGVGIISGLLGRDFDIDLSLIDKQPKALFYAKKNFEINSLKASFYQGDFLEVEFQKRFDFIISNPPFYSPTVIQSKNSSLNISRYAHHLPLEEFISKSKKLLKPRGYLIFCYDAKQTDRILANLKQNRLQPQALRFIHPKQDREAKLLMVSARANSKSECKIRPPLILFDKNSNYLQEAKETFLEANSYSVTASFD